MEIRVVMGDIAAMDVDVVVTAANQFLIGGGGVDVRFTVPPDLPPPTG